MATWNNWVTAAEKLNFEKIVIVQKSNDTIIAANKDADITTMFQFKPSWKSAIKGDMIITNWFRSNCCKTEETKENVFPDDVKNLCLQYRYAVNEMEELKKDWKNNRSVGTIHLFGDKYFVVHRDEKDGNWIVGRLEDNCVFGWEGKTIWFVVAAPIKGNHSAKSGVDQSKLKPIQSLFADFMRNIVYPLQEAKC
mmetsp:Transcript_37734/g.33344  ORF Transcript_37734/g.33344 Transcript_37734/m.33344 type:complete len:195 (+) Transcript_37734:22-606(+)